jgi:putative NADH-flavin reductase
MDLLILGGTGRTGRLVVDEAIQRGHAVIAIVRRKEALTVRKGLTVLSGDPTNAAALSAVLSGMSHCEAVISCLGQTSRKDGEIVRKSAKAMLEAMGQTNTHRYLVLSAAMLFPSFNPAIHLLRLMLSRHVKDTSAMEAIVKESNIDWTIIRPPRLTDGKVGRGYRLAIGHQPKGPSAIRRIDVATYLVDEVEQARHKKLIVGLTSG